MPAQASTVTAVRMVLHIFARFASDWISRLMAANNSSRYQEARTNVETAVQDSGFIPLLASAASALAAAMQQEQQQPQQQPRQPTPPLPAVSLAGEVLNVWVVLVHCIADAPPPIPTVLSHQQLSASVGPITLLALTALQCWDGAREPSGELRRGSITTVGILGVDTDSCPEDLWSGAVQCAAAMPDLIADAWRKQVNREQQASGGRRPAHMQTDLCSNRAVNEAMSVPTAAPLALFHLGVVSDLVHRQWRSSQQQQQQQGQIQQHHRELFRGLSMPAIAASPQPLVQYHGLDKLHLLNALTAAYQTAFNRSQASALAAHRAASWGAGDLSADSIRDLSSTGIPAGLHSTVSQLLLSLLSLCAPFKGHQDLKVLSTGLRMLHLVLSDAALLQHSQHSFADIISGGTAGANGSTVSSGGTAAASPSPEALAGAMLGQLLTVVGPLCAKGQADHPFAAQLFPPMAWNDLFAAEEGGELLPLFGGLLRDSLLVMSPEGATAALAAAHQAEPVAAAQILEWVLRGCIRVEKPNGGFGTVSRRSCGPGPPAGTCSTELKPATTNPCLARAAATAAAATADGSAAPDSSAAAAAATSGPGGAGAATVGSTSLSECLKDALGCLVLLCHRVALGVAAAGGSNGSSMATGGSSGSSNSTSTAAKHQVAVLNSCLKLLNRLAVPADEEASDDMEEDGSYDGGSDFGGRGSHTLTPAGKWWACQAAAAAAAFGAALATSTAAAAGAGGSSSSGSGDGIMLKLHAAGVSLAARGLLFVSRHIGIGSSCATTDQQHGAQQTLDLLRSVLSSCRVLQASLAEMSPRGREEALRRLQEQGQSLLDRLSAGAEEQQPTGGLSVQQVLTGLAGDLQQFCTGMAAQVLASFGCNYTECVNLLGESELSVATSKCSRCKLAYFCSKECQAASWSSHKEARNALKPAAV